MRIEVYLIVLAFDALQLSANTVRPLDIKKGLWEVTTTHSMAGMPSLPTMPPKMLAQMPEAQRKLLEGNINSLKNGRKIEKRCITQAKLEKHAAFNHSEQDCDNKIVKSTANTLEIAINCPRKKGMMNGTYSVEAINAEHVTGTFKAQGSSNGHSIDMNLTFSSKYLGPKCGDIM